MKHNKNRQPNIGKEKRDDSDNWIWGINPVMEGLLASIVSEIRVQKNKAGNRLQEIIDLARSRGVKVRFVEENRLGVGKNCRHQGVAARRAEVALLSFDDFSSSLVAAEEENNKLLLLDSIQDPGNLGSILRTALAAGFKHVLMTSERSAPLSAAVVMSSAGALAHLQICRVVNLANAMDSLKEQGFWFYGSVVDADAQSVYDVDYSGRVGLVIGSEGKGIRPLIKKKCDFLLTIPMKSGFDSLNASVAAGILMFAIDRGKEVQTRQIKV